MTHLKTYHHTCAVGCRILVRQLNATKVRLRLLSRGLPTPINGVACKAETTYRFYFTADASGSEVLDDIAYWGSLIFVSSPGRKKLGAGASTASIPIHWNKGASMHTYYLWFEVSAPGGCF